MRGMRIEMQNRPRICTAGRWHFSPAFLPSPPAGCLWLQSGQIVKSFCLGGPKNHTLDRTNCSFGQIASWGIVEPIIANVLRRMNCQTVRTVLLAGIGFFLGRPRQHVISGPLANLSARIGWRAALVARQSGWNGLKEDVGFTRLAILPPASRRMTAPPATSHAWLSKA